MKQVRWTKRCKDGTACNLGGQNAFVPDDQTICDGCLLARFDFHGTYDRCSDPLAINTLYDEKEVVAALRKAMRSRKENV